MACEVLNVNEVVYQVFNVETISPLEEGCTRSRLMESKFFGLSSLSLSLSQLHVAKSQAYHDAYFPHSLTQRSIKLKRTPAKNQTRDCESISRGVLWAKMDVCVY